MVKGRVGENRNAAVLQNQLDCLRRGDFFSGYKIFTVVAHISGKSFCVAIYIIVVFQINRIMRPRQHGVGMFFTQLFIGDVDTVFLQVSAHFDVSFRAGVYERLYFCLKRRLFVLNIKSHNMNIFAFIFGGKFNARNHFNGLARRMGNRLIEAVRRIVVCQGKSGEPLFQRVVHQFRRGKCAVRFI